MKYLLIFLLLPTILFSQEIDEMEFFHEINLVRTNPKLYASILEEMIQEWKGAYDASFFNSAEEAIYILRHTKPMDSLTYDFDIREQLNNHNGIDSTNYSVRHDINCISKYQFVAENISFGRTARKAVIYLLIDHEVEDRAHRLAILNSTYKFTAVRKITFGSGKFGTRTFWIQEFAKR